MYKGKLVNAVLEWYFSKLYWVEFIYIHVICNPDYYFNKSIDRLSAPENIDILYQISLNLVSLCDCFRFYPLIIVWYLHKCIYIFDVSNMIYV